MSVEIKEITDKKNYKEFIQFQIDLYKGNACYVPPLISDEVATIDSAKNPAFDYCEARFFMAYRNGKAVGRIAGIINNQVNEVAGKKEIRFGYIDFIDDDEVVDALIAAVTSWAKEKGMTHILGPMGFTDMDHEGMLYYGFDEMGTMATIYNYDYYPKQLARIGMTKEAGWVEYQIQIPDRVPDKHMRITEIVRKKYNLRVLKYTGRPKELVRDYGVAFFELINEAYADLFGYSTLSRKQIDYYLKLYIPMIPLDHVPLIVDENGTLIGVGVSLPNLTRALQKAKGKMLPFGWYHLLKAIKCKVDVVDLMLIAVKPEYQSKGVNALLFTDLINVYIEHHYRYAETNLELEDNEKVQSQWQYFEHRLHRKRMVVGKDI